MTVIERAEIYSENFNPDFNYSTSESSFCRFEEKTIF